MQIWRRVSAKALRQEQAWCVERNSKEAIAPTVERARRRGVDMFTEAAIGLGLMEPYGYWTERSFTMRWEAIGGLYAKECNRARVEAGSLIRKEATAANNRQRRWWPGPGWKQWWWQKVVALGMDSAGPASRPWWDSWGVREKEGARKNGVAVSCKWNWSGGIRIPLWTCFSPVRNVLTHDVGDG